MQNSITAAQGVVESADLATAYARAREVILEAEEANLSRSRDIRGPLAHLIETLETRAMDALESARDEYFAGSHDTALASFEELATYEGLRAAREAEGELRKEDDRAEWRSIRASVTQQMTQADFKAAQEGLRTLDRRARRTGYDAAMETMATEFAATAASHVDRAKNALEAERYEDAYGTLLEVSRLTTLRVPANEARQLLREHSNTPGMRQAQREYDSADALADARQELADADGRNAREAVQRKLEALATRYEGTRAAEQAQQLASELSEQLATR